MSTVRADGDHTSAVGWTFDPNILSHHDKKVMDTVIGLDRGGIYRNPDLVIAPDGQPYLYRWCVVDVPDHRGNTFLHVQISSDPERPLHDHPWDNTSVILSGGYDEEWRPNPVLSDETMVRKLRAGDMVHRKASEAHRLVLPLEFAYTMTIFTTGPRLREWGFWYPDGWRSYLDTVRIEGNVSVHIGEKL